MAYEKVFESSYPNGWKDQPDKSTPAYASTFDGYDEAIEHIEDFLDGSTAVKPVAKTEAMTQEVGIDPSTGALYTTPGGGGGSGEAKDIEYDNTQSGLESDNVQGAIDELAAGAGSKVTPVEKTEAMTQPVGIDEETGELWTAPGGEAPVLQSKGNWTKLLDVRDGSSQTADSYNLADSIFNYDTIRVAAYYKYDGKYILGSTIIPVKDIITGSSTAWYTVNDVGEHITFSFSADGLTMTKNTGSQNEYFFSVYGYNGGSMSIAGDTEEVYLYSNEHLMVNNEELTLLDTLKNYDDIIIRHYYSYNGNKIFYEHRFDCHQIAYGSSTDKYWAQGVGSQGGFYFHVNTDGDKLIIDSTLSDYIATIVGVKKKVYAPIIDASLVRWYDGINNTGSGHDNTATSWKDLSGNQDILSVNTSIWSDDCITPNGQYSLDTQFVYGTEPSTSISMEAYFNIGNDSNSDSQILSFTSNSGMNIQIKNGNICSYVRDSSGYMIISAPMKKFNKIHAVISFDIVNNAFKFYVNGELIDTLTVSSYVGNNLATKIASNATGSYIFTGAIYDARIYNRVLTAEEIQQNYQYDLHRFSGLAE